MKKIIVFLLCFSSLTLFAQTRIITGTVVDEAGEPVIGASVVVTGTTVGTVTDFDGKYSLELPDGAEQLTFSFIGYSSVTRPIGAENVIDITLLEDATELGQVVVNALGFKEDKDALGSTSSIVDPDAAVRSGETGVINGLSGKAAGVRIARSNGDPGAGSTIQIRGANTITGETQPLIIVDGIPISNSTFYGEGNGSQAGGVTQQSRLNDLNPDDIASLQILKGASAASLWGSRASNGVIVITTKEGEAGKLRISYSATYSIDQINAKHPLTSKWGQGRGGNWSRTNRESWGDKIADRSGADNVVDKSTRFVSDDGRTFHRITEKNSKETFVDQNFDQVFQNGSFLKHALSVSGGNSKANTFFSFSDLNQEGIIKNSDYRRTTLRLNNNFHINDKVNLTTKGTYTQTSSSRIQQSSNVSGLYLGLLRNPADFDISAYKGTFYDASGAPFLNRHRAYRRQYGESSTNNAIYNNPLWTINEQKATNKVDRFTLSSQLDYSPTNNLNFTLRGGVDSYSDHRIYFFPKGSSGTVSGLSKLTGVYIDESVGETEINFDAIGKYNLALNDNIHIDLLLGWNINDRRRNHVYVGAQNFLFDSRVQNFRNTSAEGILAENNRRFIRSNRLYSTVGLDLYEQVFINISMAQEAASSLKGTFFYPAVDLAWQFTQLPVFDNLGFLSFGKLRLAYGQVGVQAEAHRGDLFTYENASYTTYSSSLNASLFNGGLRLNDDLGNPNLKPEIKTETEVGIDLRFLDNRLSLGFTYYKNTIDDILLFVNVAPSTGFTSRYNNAGKMQNSGIELDWDYTFLKKQDLSLALYGNFNNNKNKVLDLKGSASVDFTPGASISSRALVGEASGVLYGNKAIRKADGSFDLDENGFPQLSPAQGKLGDPNADWRGGIGLRANWKNLSFNILFETYQGADFAERTRFILANFGTHTDVEGEVTLTKDLKNVAGNTIAAGTTVRGKIANFGGGDVLLDESWYRGRGAGFGSAVINEFAIADGSWWRLREISLGYTLNSKAFQDATKLNSINFSITGRNLILWTGVVGIDPEISQYGVNNGFGIDYFTNPSTRSYLFTIKVNY